MLKVALTHDIDRTVKTYQYFTHSMGALKIRDFRSAWYHATSWHRRKEVYWNFQEIMDIESRYGATSTFFFLIESYPFTLLKPSSWKLALGRYNIHEKRIMDVIHFLDKNGWEVGLHGSYRSYNNLHLLQSEKYLLEEILGHSAAGCRQHYLNWNENTWGLQQRAGFKYDASWGFTRQIGFKGNKIKPFFPLNNHFAIFPLAIMDLCYMRTSNRREVLEKLIDEVVENDAILVINWHNNYFNHREYPGWKDAYVEVIETCQEYGAIFQTLEKFYQLYTHKKQVIP